MCLNVDETVQLMDLKWSDDLWLKHDDTLPVAPFTNMD